jgi:hypothetical protein
MAADTVTASTGLVTTLPGGTCLAQSPVNRMTLVTITAGPLYAMPRWILCGSSPKSPAVMARRGGGMEAASGSRTAVERFSRLIDRTRTSHCDCRGPFPLSNDSAALHTALSQRCGADHTAGSFLWARKEKNGKPAGDLEFFHFPKKQHQVSKQKDICPPHTRLKKPGETYNPRRTSNVRIEFLVSFISPTHHYRGVALHYHAVFTFLARIGIPLDRFQLHELRRIKLHLFTVGIIGVGSTLLGLQS